MEHVRQVSREFVTGQDAVLHLEARSGSVRVEAHASDRVQVDATVRVYSVSSDDADEAARAVADAMEQDGAGRVIVRAPALPEVNGGWSLLKLGQRGASIDYRVRVPTSTAARVLSRSGSVEITGVHGRVHAEVISGRCRVHNVAGETTVVARSGAVEVDRVDGKLVAEARSGRVHVSNVHGPAEVESRSGAVDVARVSGDLRVGSRSGRVTVEEPGAAVRVHARCGPVNFSGAVRGNIDIEVSTGPIVFAADPDTPFFIDAETRVGPITSDLPKRATGGTPNAGPKVRLRTNTGPIHLTRA